MKPHCSRTVLIRLSLCLTLLACVSVCCLNFLSLRRQLDRKSTRLNSSHSQISYAVFCLKKNEIRRPYSGGARRQHRPLEIAAPPSCAALLAHQRAGEHCRPPRGEPVACEQTRPTVRVSA